MPLPRSVKQKNQKTITLQIRQLLKCQPKVWSVLKSKAFSLGILTISKLGMVTVFLRHNSADSLTTQVDLEKENN